MIDILFARTEFNLFNWRTSGEEVSDEEWAVVVANFPLEQGELTLDGFLTLHHMEAEDNGGDEAELRVTLQTMGWVAARIIIIMSSNDSFCYVSDTTHSWSRTSPLAST